MGWSRRFSIRSIMGVGPPAPGGMATNTLDLIEVPRIFGWVVATREAGGVVWKGGLRRVHMRVRQSWTLERK